MTRSVTRADLLNDRRLTLACGFSIEALYKIQYKTNCRTREIGKVSTSVAQVPGVILVTSLASMGGPVIDKEYP